MKQAGNTPNRSTWPERSHAGLSGGRQDAESQPAELLQFANVQGWEITGEYIDRESGSRADPAEFGPSILRVARNKAQSASGSAWDR
jgi:hypothetical protein